MQMELTLICYCCLSVVYNSSLHSAPLHNYVLISLICTQREEQWMLMCVCVFVQCICIFAFPRFIFKKSVYLDYHVDYVCIVWLMVSIHGCKFKLPTPFQHLLLSVLCQWCVTGCRGLAHRPRTVMLTGCPLPPLSAPETLIRPLVQC